MTKVNILEVDFGDHVVLWKRGTRVIEVWDATRFATRDQPNQAPNQTVAVPRGTQFAQANLYRIAHALHGELDTAADGEPDAGAYRRRALLLNQTAYFEPAHDPYEETPAITVAGLAVHVYVDRDTRQYRVGIHLDGVPEWMLDEDGTVPIKVMMNDEVLEPKE